MMDKFLYKFCVIVIYTSISNASFRNIVHASSVQIIMINLFNYSRQRLVTYINLTVAAALIEYVQSIFIYSLLSVFTLQKREK